MANKGVKIPVGIELNTKDFIKDITIATSESGKALQKELTPAINKAEAQLKKFAEIQKQVLSTGVFPKGVNASYYKLLEQTAEAAKNFLNKQNDIIEVGNKFSKVYTEAYSTLEDKLQQNIKSTEEYDAKIKDVTKDIELLTRAGDYENKKSTYDSVIQEYERLLKQEENLTKAKETRQRHLKEDFDKSVEEYRDAAQKLLKEAHDAKTAGDRTTYKDKMSEYTKLTDEYMRIKNQSDLILTNDRALKSFNTQLENTQNKIENLFAEYQKAQLAKNSYLEALSKGITANDIPTMLQQIQEYKNVLAELEIEIKRITDEQQKLDKSGQKYTTRGITDTAANYLRELANVFTLISAKSQEAADKMDKLSHNTREASNAFNSARKGATTFKQALNKIVSGIKKVISAFQKLSHHTRKSFDSSHTGIKGALRLLMRYGLGVRSLYFLFRRLRKAAREAFEVMAQQWDPVNKQISSMIQSLNGVKGSIATMLQPLLETFAGFFNQFMAILQKVMETIGAFFAMLTGQNYILRAKAPAVDWAASLADDLGKANDEAEKLNKQLAGFDKLNNLTTKDNNDSGSGKNDIGVGSVIFEKVPIEQLDLFNWLKEMWDKEDFSDLGRMLNEKLTNMLERLDWTKIEDYGRKIGKCLATALNGFFENEDLASEIGEAIAGWLNTAFSFIGSFATNFKWDEFGEFIKTGINSFLDNAQTYDWGFSVGSIVRGLIEAIYNVVSDKEMWKELGTKIKDGINGFFDSMSETKKVFKGFGIAHVPIYEELNGWQMAGSGLSDFLDGLITTLTEVIDNPEAWSAFGKAVCDMISSIKWGELGLDLLKLAWAIIEGLALAFAQILSGNGSLEILGPGTELGAKVIDGMIDGESFEKAAEDALTPELTTALVNATASAQPYGESSLLGVIDSITENVAQHTDTSSIGNSIGDGVEIGLKQSGLPNWVAVFFNGVVRAVCNILGIHSPSTVFAGIASNIITGFLNPFNTLKSKWITIWEGLKSAIKAPLNGVIGFLNSMISAVERMINSIGSGINSIASSISGSAFAQSAIGRAVGLDNFSINISSKSLPRIPYLAKGAVIPPNKEFLAMLGDQKSGTNIEAPLETIEQALRNVMSEQNINVTFEVQGDPEHIFNIVRKQSNQFSKRTGLSWT